MSEKEKKLTIRKFFENNLDDENAFLFRMVYNGQSYAGTNKRPTRVSIIIPKEIAENNLQFIREWDFYVVGFKHK